MSAARIADLRLTLKSLARTQREYSSTAAHLRRQLENLDPFDPESRDAAREWLSQLMHAERCEAEAERYAQRARNEIVDLREKARETQPVI